MVSVSSTIALYLLTVKNIFCNMQNMNVPTGATIIMNPKIYNRKMSKMMKKLELLKAEMLELNEQYVGMKNEFPEFWLEYCAVNDLNPEHTGFSIESKKTPQAIDCSKWDW